jgi:hypothetical protein
MAELRITPVERAEHEEAPVELHRISRYTKVESITSLEFQLGKE